ncbi:protein of unknown function DUF4283 [Macleaya cordata]|uniref:DUF4283 domain-containing protein n=1 Tax=Macleaya cordata TaxID=56857 RepID=A0A200QTD5_MACCD|nr:protein of unknown function DUF4283 [Macleaya cordata]
MDDPVSDSLSDLTSKMASTSLQRPDKERGIIINIPPEDLRKVNEDWKIWLVGRICTDVVISTEKMDKAMHNLWMTAKPFDVNDAGENKYMTQFQILADRTRILNGSPWFFHGFILVLKIWDPDIDIDQMNLDTEALWIRMNKLSFQHRSNVVAKSIAAGVSEVIKLENPRIMPHNTTSISFKVMISVKSSIPSGATIPRSGGNNTWIP